MRRWKRNAQISVSTDTQIAHMFWTLCCRNYCLIRPFFTSARLWSVYWMFVFVYAPRWWRQRVCLCSEECLSEVRPSRHSEHPVPALLPRHQVLFCAASLPTGQCVCVCVCLAISWNCWQMWTLTEDTFLISQTTEESSAHSIKWKWIDEIFILFVQFDAW